MSIANEIVRIMNAKTALKASIENKGVDVPDETLIDGYPALVDQITGGGPTPVPIEWLPNPQGYLRFKFITDGQVIWENWLQGGMVEYSKDGGLTWTPFANESMYDYYYYCGEAVSMNSGDEIWFRGNFVSNGPGSGDDLELSKFTTTGKFYVSGNIQSLSNFSNTLHVYQFSGLFKNCKGLNIDTQTPLVLPVTTLANYCYSNMFSGCSSLTAAPELPATTLAHYCYSGMFEGCSSLTAAPELPATTLANYCYSHMFDGCSSLTIAPELPATTLTFACYEYMFRGCVSLTSSPELPAPTLETGCYESMFENCFSLNHIIAGFNTTPDSNTTYYWVNRVASEGFYAKAYNATYTDRGISAIPERWKAAKHVDWLENENNYLRLKMVEDNSEEIYIFSLYPLEYSINGGTWVSCQETSWGSGYSCYVQLSNMQEIWFRGNFNHDERREAGSGSGSGSGSGGKTGPITGAFMINTRNKCFVSGNIQSLCNFENEITVSSMFNMAFSNCIGLDISDNPLVLAATALTEYCYYDMFYDCTSLTTVPELPATTLANSCYAGMFQGCTSLTEKPELPATTLANECYSHMFDGCTSLTTAPELPATTLVNRCYSGMFYNCSSLNSIKALFTTTPSNEYTSDWVYGVAGTGTFYKAENASWEETGTYGVPSGWTVVRVSS